jgi:hypothetical protein
MAREKQKAFVVTVSLKSPRGAPKDALALAARQARQLEQQLLAWGLAKLNFIRNNIPRKRIDFIKAQPKDKRPELYGELWAEAGLTEQAMETHQQEIRANYAHLCNQSAVCQKLRTKTFKRIFDYATGKTGRPRFKSSKGFNLPALEAKELHSGIVVRADTVSFDGIDHELRWDPNNPFHAEARRQIENFYAFQRQTRGDGYKQAVADAMGKVKADNPQAGEKQLGKLQRRAVKEVKAAFKTGPTAKYGRIVFKRAKHGTVARLQIVCSGIAPMSHNMASTLIPKKSNAVDIGPSMVAHASGDASVVGAVDLVVPEAREIQKEIGRLQRRLKRKKKGSRAWRDLSNEIGWLHRVSVEVTQRAHAALHLEILRGGSLLRREDHGVKFLQRNRHYSRSVSRNRPAAFMAGLTYKAEKAGGSMTEIPCGKAKLSQVCIFRDYPVKKPLGQRFHELPNGVLVQRDQYSAWLANFADPATGALDRTAAKEVWGIYGVETRLTEAWAATILKREQGNGPDCRSTLGRPPADGALSSENNGCRQSCFGSLAPVNSRRQDREPEGRPFSGSSGRIPETRASTDGAGAGPDTPA